MMHAKTTGRVLLYQWIGLASVLTVLWLEEILDLPHVLFGSEPTPVNIGELLIETALVLPVAVVMTWLTTRLMHRVRHLEGLLRICGFCSRVRDGHTWVPLDTYLSDHSEAELTSTFCMDCIRGFHSGQSRYIETPEDPSP